VDERKPLLYGFFIGRTPLISLSPKKTWEAGAYTRSRFSSTQAVSDTHTPYTPYTP